MKIGVLAFIASYTQSPASVARKCEELGFESLWLPEHPILPVNPKTPFPRGDGTIPEIYAQMIDPFVGLALAAGATREIKLGTGICLVPERDPIILAKEIATLDHYSGGRFLFGIGAGWLRDETEIMGVEFRRRWPITREYVSAMKELWTKPESSFSGEFIKFPAVRCFPKPAQKPHPPVLIGAAGERALKNTAAYADGWMPIAIDPVELKMQLGSLKRMCDEVGRNFSKLEISVFSPLGGKDPHKALQEYGEVGVHRLVLFPPTLSPDKADRELEELSKAWID
ncbi:MAG TPA: LLM class F420-dependent oxidoreductase [Candidatus Binataceae bacterium]